MPRRRDWGRLVSKTLLLLVGIIFFLPFVWMFLSSLKPSTEVLSSGANLFGSRLEWGNYVDAFTSVPFGRILLNTFGIAAADLLAVDFLNPAAQRAGAGEEDFVRLHHLLHG